MESVSLPRRLTTAGARINAEEAPQQPAPGQNAQSAAATYEAPTAPDRSTQRTPPAAHAAPEPSGSSAPSARRMLPPTVMWVPDVSTLEADITACMAKRTIEELFMLATLRDADGFAAALRELRSNVHARGLLAHHRKTDKCYTLLHWLCVARPPDPGATAWEDQLPAFVRDVIGLGADVNATARDNITALHLAVGWDESMRTELMPMLQARATVFYLTDLMTNEENATHERVLGTWNIVLERRLRSFHLAAAHWRQQDRIYRPRLVQALLESNASVNTLLHCSALRDHFALPLSMQATAVAADVQALLDDCRLVDSPAGRPPRPEGTILQIYRGLVTCLEKRPLLQELSPLEIACCSRDYRAVKLLLAAERHAHLNETVMISRCVRHLDAPENPLQQAKAGKIHKRVFTKNWRWHAVDMDSAMQIILRAAQQGDQEMLHLIMDRAHAPKSKNSHGTKLPKLPFINRTDSQNVSMFIALLRYCPTPELIARAIAVGADINYRMRSLYGVCTPLIVAAGFCDTARMVGVAMVVDATYRDWSVAHNAVLRSTLPGDLPSSVAIALSTSPPVDAGILKQLIDAGADPTEVHAYTVSETAAGQDAPAEVKFTLRVSVLDLAVATGSTEAIDYLLQLDAVRTHHPLRHAAAQIATYLGHLSIKTRLEDIASA